MRIRGLIVGVITAVLVSLTFGGCGTGGVSLTPEDVTQEIEIGVLRFRLPRNATRLPAHREGIAGSGFWEIPGVFEFRVFHTDSRDSEHTIENSSHERPYAMVLDVPGATEVWARVNWRPEGGFFADVGRILMLRPCGTTISVSFSMFADGVYGDEFYALRDGIMAILESLEIVESFDPPAQEATVGPLRLRLPEEASVMSEVPDRRYAVTGLPFDIPNLTIADTVDYPLTYCRAHETVPGAAATELCEIRRVLACNEELGEPCNSSLVLRIELPDGTSWFVQGATAINEPLIRAIFDTVTVDPDWSQQ